jgi:PAS domain S-box-containing protein
MFDKAMDTLSIAAMTELSPLLSSIMGMLGIDPYSRKYRINEQTRASLTAKRLVKFTGGTYEFAHGALPEKVCTIIEKKLGIINMYTMGIVKNDLILGGVGIVMRWSKDLENKEMVEAFINQASVALMRRRAEESYRQSEERFRRLFDNVPGVAIQGYSPDGIIHYWNRASREIFGYTGHEAIGKNVVELLVPAEYQEQAYQLMSKAINLETLPPPGVIPLLHRDGTIVPVFSSHMIVNATRSKREFFSLEVDLRARIQFEEQIKASLREKEILLREIHHRVKNNMQVISSLLSLQAHSIHEPATRTILRESQNRVKSMALVHEKLYRSSDLALVDFEAYLQSLMIHLFRTFGKGNVTYTIQAKNIYLGIDQAIPCGLIVNELVSNALKYAFPEEMEGIITIKIVMKTDEIAMMHIMDNGTGFPKDLDFRSTSTLGLQLVNDLVHQIDGEIDMETGRNTAFSISFKI